MVSELPGAKYDRLRIVFAKRNEVFGQVVDYGGPINHHWTTSPERLGGAFAAQTLWRLGSAPLHA